MDDERDDRRDPYRLLRRLEEQYEETQRVLRGWYEAAGEPLGEEGLDVWVEYSVWTTVN